MKKNFLHIVTECSEGRLLEMFPDRVLFVLFLPAFPDGMMLYSSPSRIFSDSRALLLKTSFLPHLFKKKINEPALYCLWVERHTFSWPCWSPEPLASKKVGALSLSLVSQHVPASDLQSSAPCAVWRSSVLLGDYTVSLWLSLLPGNCLHQQVHSATFLPFFKSHLKPLFNEMSLVGWSLNRTCANYYKELAVPTMRYAI